MLGRIEIIIADDHVIFRDGLKQVFINSPHIIIVGEASTGKEAVELAKEKLPDIILMDVIMPEMDGIKATCILKKELPQIKIIGLSMNAEKSIITGITEAGAKGYLVKDAPGAEVILAIKSVHRGESFFSQRILQNGVNIPPPLHASPANVLYGLKENYIQVLKYICAGYPTKQIAFEMNLKTKTVEWYKYRLKTLTRATSSAELIVFAVKNHICD